METRYNVPKMDYSSSGVAFTDEKHNTVGASAFSLLHDAFMNDAAATTLIIRTAAGGGGTLLTENTDYLIGGIDNLLTAQVGKNVYTTVTVTNAAYQACDLYFSGKFIADYIKVKDINMSMPVYYYKTGAYVIKDSDASNMVLDINGAFTMTLPALSLNIGKRILIRNYGTSLVTITPNGTDTINGVNASIYAYQQRDFLELIAFETSAGVYDWRIVSEKRTFYYLHATTYAVETINIAHGFGIVPTRIRGVFVCTSAENGYAIGDEITMNQWYDSDTLSCLNNIVADATNITVLCGAAMGYMLKRSDRTLTTPTANKWKVKIYYDR